MPETSSFTRKKLVREGPARAIPPGPFVELGISSPFSFLRGASDSIELVLAAADMGMDSIGIADRNTLAGVVRMHSAAKGAGLACIPGIATPTEGFAALANGADALKLFPAELLTPAVLKSMRAVFPSTTRFLPVGGITPDSMAGYVAAGAAGFGLGGALYRRGDDAPRVAANARDFVAAWKRLRSVAG